MNSNAIYGKVPHHGSVGTASSRDHFTSLEGVLFMNRTALTTVTAVVCSFAVGLGWSYYTGQKAQGVAVVDLDEVARKLGRDAEMVQSFQGEAGRLNQALQYCESEPLVRRPHIIFASNAYMITYRFSFVTFSVFLAFLF